MKTNSVKKILAITFCWVTVAAGFAQTNSGNKQRIIVSTDIGGTDFDDYQSLAHLFLYADTFDIEGLIASPYGEGGKKHILEAIDAYEKDYANLQTHSAAYPTPELLRSISKQGALDLPGLKGYAQPTEGSEWIVQCARKQDERPLNILIWGGIDDLAQALHDAPDILPKLRVYYIGGPNKKWSVNAYHYITKNFKTLWMIESNATYYGWFEGGNQQGAYGNKAFVEQHIKGKGALGAYFYEKGDRLKMGDTPSLMYFLRTRPNDPTQPGWGGQYIRAWERQYAVFNRLTTRADSVEEYSVVELRLPYVEKVENPYAIMKVTNQALEAAIENDTVRFLFSPKTSAHWEYTIESNIPSLQNKKGNLVSYLTPPTHKNFPSEEYPNWWADDPSDVYREGKHIGVKTINRWREDFLDDFARRMERCSAPAR